MEGLDDGKKLEQVMKANHFLEFARNALISHFKIWVNDLLFLSLFSEQQTSHVVAKYLHPSHAAAEQEEAPVREYSSPMHQRTIDLTKFEAFLMENCTKRETIMATPHVNRHQIAIKCLATTNQDMWSDGSPLLLLTFRQHYCEKYAALPSNTHRAESTIKDANHSQIKGREEVLCSTYATARSGIVEKLNSNCLQAQSSRPIKGNASVTGGKAGERKRKSDDTDYEEKVFKKRVDSYVRSEQAIKLVVARHIKIDGALTGSDEKQEKWESLRADLSDRAKQFVAEQRVGEKVGDFRENFGKHKPLNVLQKRAGLCEAMPVIRGELPFIKLLKDRDMQQVQMELRFRGLSDQGKWRDGMIARFKANECNNKYFKIRCPDVDLDHIRTRRDDNDNGND
jgi:hypothetical protein